MPEGDTVWLTARRLDEALGGRPLTVSDFRVPRWAELDLVGRQVVETISRGKHILTRLEDVTIHTHLKMDGSWHIYRPGSPWRMPGFQARLVLANEEWQTVGFQLGVVDVLLPSEEQAILGHLGPDLLGPDWSVSEAVRRLSSDPHVPVGEALLDQRNLAGVGNVYKSEACFLLGVHPSTPVGRVDVLPQLADKLHRLLVANRDRAEQVTTGNRRRGQRTWVYGRGGQRCRRCGSQVERDVQGSPGRDRSTFWCPTCQPAP